MGTHDWGIGAAAEGTAKLAGCLIVVLGALLAAAVGAIAILLWRLFA